MAEEGKEARGAYYGLNPLAIEGASGLSFPLLFQGLLLVNPQFIAKQREIEQSETASKWEVIRSLIRWEPSFPRGAYS